MNREQCIAWYALAPKPACDYVQRTAAGYIAQIGGSGVGIKYVDGAGDAFAFAVNLAAFFWKVEPEIKP